MFIFFEKKSGTESSEGVEVVGSLLPLERDKASTTAVARLPCVAVETDKTPISSCTIANLYSSQLVFIWFSKGIVFNSNWLVTYCSSVPWLVVVSVRVCQRLPFLKMFTFLSRG